MKKVENASVEPKKLNKEVVKWVRFTIVVVISLALIYVVFNYVPFIAKYEHYVIRTNSMEPVINVNDIVFIDSSVSTDDLQVEDIVAVKADINNDGTKEVVVHYLYSIDETNGVKTYQTHPYGIDTPDRWTVSEADIIGIYSFKIPKIGMLLMFAQSTIGRIVLIADLFIIFYLIDIVSKSKKNEDEQEQGNSDSNADPKEKTEEISN